MLAALVAEKRAREEAEAAVAFIADEGTYADSYGVPGSDFGVCRFCEAGGAPGIPFEHNKTCPILRCEEVSAEWLSGRLEARVRRLWGCHPSRRRCDKCNAVLAEARSPLAPKEDTNA